MSEVPEHLSYEESILRLVDLVNEAHDVIDAMPSSPDAKELEAQLTGFEGAVQLRAIALARPDLLTSPTQPE